jgi:hypothetical protein
MDLQRKWKWKKIYLAFHISEIFWGTNIWPFFKNIWEIFDSDIYEGFINEKKSQI